MQRLEEAKIAMFSKWSSGQLAWNREETAKGLTPPSEQFYVQVLVCFLMLCPTGMKQHLDRCAPII